ncbi:hypothetical protein HY389_02365 [Candidatus Daviesbacteria bacterium]|nr:hypothetical protein [Candidatus Daviesbacteria bacterium]
MPNNSFERGSVSLLAAGAVVAVVVLVVLASVQVPRSYFSGKGDVRGVSLAKGGDDSGSSGSESPGGSGNSGGGSDSHSSGSSGGSSGSSGGSNSGSGGSGGPASTPRPSAKPTPRVEFERIETPKRAETQIQAQNIQAQVRQGLVKVEFELEDGKVKIKAKTEAGEVPENDLNEVENEVEKNEVKIATGAGQMAFFKNNAGAISKFPLQLDLKTDQLIASTSAGVRVVAVLPEAAIKNMLASRVMDDLQSENVGGSLASIAQLVKLEERNGILVYEIKGDKKHTLLGFIPIKTPVTAFVSAENGAVVATDQSLLARILNRIAP